MNLLGPDLLDLIRAEVAVYEPHAIVRLRFLTSVHAEMPTVSYEGVAAVDRLEAFCANFLSGLERARESGAEKRRQPRRYPPIGYDAEHVRAADQVAGTSFYQRTTDDGLVDGDMRIVEIDAVIPVPSPPRVCPEWNPDRPSESDVDEMHAAETTPLHEVDLRGRAALDRIEGLAREVVAATRDRTFTERAVADLRREALASDGEPVFRDVCGWRLGLSRGTPSKAPSKEAFDAYAEGIRERVGGGGLPATYERMVVATEVARATGADADLWTFSASLHPMGRSSTGEDWECLGRLTAMVGVPDGSLRTSFETTHPNAVHYWTWREDEYGREKSGA